MVSGLPAEPAGGDDADVSDEGGAGAGPFSFDGRPSFGRSAGSVVDCGEHGVQFRQCTTSIRGSPETYDPTRILRHDFPSLSRMGNGPSAMGLRGVVLARFTNTWVASSAAGGK